MFRGIPSYTTRNVRSEFATIFTFEESRALAGAREVRGSGTVLCRPCASGGYYRKL